MAAVSTLTAYPIFRLTLALATGIFLSERLFSGYLSVSFLWGCLLVGTALTAGLYFIGKYRSRFFFGGIISLCFIILGMLLSTLRVEQVRYDWLEEECVYTAIVEDIPQPKKKTLQAKVRVMARQDTLQNCWIPVDRSVLLYWMPDSLQDTPAIGDRICFQACIRRPASAALLTGFDYGRYLEVQGVSGTAVAFRGDWKLLKREAELTFRQRALLLRESIVQKYSEWGLTGEVLAVVSALTVGDKSDLTPEQKATYSAAGVSHILALSGLHIGILAMILGGILYPLRYLRGGKTGIALVIVSLLWGFAFMTGLSPSVVRAVTMFSLYIIASLFVEDRFSGGHALVLAAFLMLLYQPLYLFDVSFQLSFIAVLSIILFYPIFSSKSVRNKPLKYVWNTMAVSLAAQLGTLPLILYYFGAFPTYFLLSNLVVTPLAVCILGTALLALCLDISAGVGVSSLIVACLKGGVIALNETMTWVQGLSSSQFTSIYYSETQVVLSFLLIAFFYSCYRKWTFRRLLPFLIVLNVWLGTFLSDKLFPEQHYLCVARSSVYIKHGRELTLLDNSSGIYQVGSLSVGLIDDGRWREKQSAFPLELDYIYVCRGFKGSLSDLASVFSPRQILFDSSLNVRYKERLKDECRERGLSYAEVAEEGMLIALES